MRILVTGASGSIGSVLLLRLARDGHELRAFARDPARVHARVPVFRGDAVSGTGLDEALDGVDVAYYLIHSMEGASGDFDALERRAAQNFVAAARRAGVRRAVYLGGLIPAGGTLSRHLASRLEVERTLLAGLPEAVALRSSIVIGARSRAFRFLVRLVERMRILALPQWRIHRTQPIDARDVTALLVAAASAPVGRGGLSLDAAGPDVVTYAELIQRIVHHLLVRRPTLELGLSATPIAAPVAAAIAGEDPGLIAPLMESLAGDLLPRADHSADVLGVRLHPLDRAVEHALREWEDEEELAAR